MAGDSKAFTFDLEESLYFEKGQEVAELRGIALEPEISIQPYEEYISIRGNIELQGEYEKVESEQDDRSLDFEDFQAKRYVEKVIDEEGLAAFSHRFPVEISVPPYRVADLNEVTVHVDSFDYEIPEPSHLKLYATIEIHGINSEVEHQRQETKEVKDTEEKEVDTVVEGNSVSELDSFEFELRKPQEEELALTDLSETELDAGPLDEQKTVEKEEIQTREEKDFVQVEETEEAAETVENTGDIRSEEAEQEDHDPDRWKKKSQTLAEFFKQLSDEEAETTDIEAEETEELVTEEDIVAAEVNETDNYEERVPEDASLLSDIFREAKEEQFTKMRLCIVQNQDTIETIAERFSVSPLQLIKQNQLEDDFEVHEGQLLYIPVN
ncbi:stage VI sporulation protein D [Oceanobacillus profundus]|uniref:Stage VI sporulation protein D n=1 Tax=Oceanobacillus profundus TaxID=372463 RepID=A0A417YIX1_9BACI|nr:stage VI sporulation protein D [Oceanobacillus profundus]MBR3118420.1 stage VI sporulation protein D [Oceanobacillus sp.]MCM3396988.1 stage VI sporulation protein D [Oceanobacillus profundus]MDO6448289.1 stage VI sporulation protein D [Oceanobacillus profundus]RHW33025.1 stage VI sporulation protein D [Oceanobacillus profundus]